VPCSTHPTSSGITKHEHCYQDFLAKVAPHGVSLADDKIQLHLIDGMTMVKKTPVEMVELATVTKRALIPPVNPSLNHVIL